MDTTAVDIVHQKLAVEEKIPTQVGILVPREQPLEVDRWVLSSQGAGVVMELSRPITSC